MKVKYIFASVLLCMLAPCYGTETGPLISPLEIKSSYSRNVTSSYFFTFTDGAMPGCYQDRGGYLVLDDVSSKELYAQMLMMMANPSRPGRVLYEFHDANPGEWDRCFIVGLYLFE